MAADDEARESTAGWIGLWLGGLLGAVGPIWLVATVALIETHPALQGVTVLIDGEEMMLEPGWFYQWFWGGLMGIGVVLALSPLGLLFAGALKLGAVLRRRREARERARYDALVGDAAVIAVQDWKVESGEG